MKKILLLTFCITLNAIALKIPTSSNSPHLRFINCKSWDLCTLDESFIAMLARAFKPVNFVETGTFKGDTTDRACRYFPFKYTIELSKELYDGVTQRFMHDKTVFPYHGDSVEILPMIIQSLKGKTLFFLDAHFSGNGTAKGSTNTPILSELEIIKKAGVTDGIIVVDDTRMFYEHNASVQGSIMEGYPSLAAIINKILEINPDYSFAIIADDLVAYPASENITVSAVTRAVTISRVYDGNNFTVDEVLAAEQIIAKATGDERATIQMLAEHCTEPWSKKAGLSRHYPLWYGLILFNENNHGRAELFLQEAKQRGLKHPYIDSYFKPQSYSFL